MIAIFSDDTDIYFARQLVGERMASASGRLPGGLSQKWALSLLVWVKSLCSPWMPAGRGKCRWVCHHTYGSAQCARLDYPPAADAGAGRGGNKPHRWLRREVVVQMQPQRMLAAGISSADIVAAIRANNENRGAGFVERNGAQWLMRIPGQAMQADDIAAITITAENGKTVHISDVAG